MRILIMYFSGTGNTDFIAHYIGEELKKKNFEVFYGPYESLNKDILHECDIILLGFPIYACDAPVFYREYIKNLNIPQGKKIFMFATMALLEGNAFGKLRRMLEAKNCEVVGSRAVKMPGSDGLVFLKKDSAYVKKISEKDFNNDSEIMNLLKIIEEKALNILDEKSNSLIEHGKAGKASKIIGGKFMGALYKPMEKILIKKLYANSSCIKCRQCEIICPAKNITVDDNGVHFSDKCYLCMRCINQCPVEAIQIGKKTVGKFRWKGPNRGFKPIKLFDIHKDNKQ